MRSAPSCFLPNLYTDSFGPGDGFREADYPNLNGAILPSFLAKVLQMQERQCIAARKVGAGNWPSMLTRR